MTKLFTMYVDTIQKLFKPDLEVGWTGERTAQLKDNTNSFKIRGALVLADFLPSMIDTLKLHMLDQVSEVQKKLKTI